jgi:hypothetical protein
MPDQLDIEISAPEIAQKIERSSMIKARMLGDGRAVGDIGGAGGANVGDSDVA